MDASKLISLFELIKHQKEDLKIYAEPFWKCLFFIPGYKYTFHHRICYYLSQYWYYKPLFVLYWLYMKHLTYKFGIQTAWNRPLPRYCTIAHFGGITFFPEECGDHLYLRQGVTVGSGGVGRHPTIGSHVQFGANSIVIGDIKIGDHVVIGAGAVVTHDVPDYAVVAGVPAKIIRIDKP